MVGEVYNINGNYPEQIDPKESKRVENSNKYYREKSKIKNKDKISSDKVDISNKAKEALDKKRYVDSIKNLPDIREEKVEKARKLINSNEIISDERIEKLAEKLNELL